MFKNKNNNNETILQNINIITIRIHPHINHINNNRNIRNSTQANNDKTYFRPYITNTIYIYIYIYIAEQPNNVAQRGRAE